MFHVCRAARKRQPGFCLLATPLVHDFHPGAFRPAVVLVGDAIATADGGVYFVAGTVIRVLVGFAGFLFLTGSENGQRGYDQTQ